ncbi:MAG TPA: DUF3141 domain-containing protein, partial [Bacillota bacterium]|nr:DUF3141 domain-containing protein [Bacillota bacterium]
MIPDQKFVTTTLEISSRLSRIFQVRARGAQERLAKRLGEAFETELASAATAPTAPWELWPQWSHYWIDCQQRAILFWDTLRQRGNNYLEHERAGKPPVLHFKYEMVLDARQFPRPVNYALVRILPPAGIKVDPKRRPYLILDPRAGHGPGIGGFKDDSQVGVALRGGHPVYFIIFFPEPEPG